MDTVLTTAVPPVHHAARDQVRSMTTTPTRNLNGLGLPSLGGQGDVGDYVALLKPRVMSLVVFTAIVGLFAAPGTIHPWFGFMAILCIAVGAGASGALNMWYDADIDAVMKRTVTPGSTGAITQAEALGFGLFLSSLRFWCWAFWSMWPQPPFWPSPSFSTSSFTPCG